LKALLWFFLVAGGARAAEPEIAPISISDLGGRTFAPAGVPVQSPAANAVRQRLAQWGVPVPAVIAHRGASAYAPEATEPSLRCAALMGADYLEFDLHLSRDGVLVLNHDDTFERTTDVRAKFPAKARSPIGEFTWPEIQRLDAAAAYRGPAGDCYAGGPARVLRLEDAMRIARSIAGRSPGIYPEAKVPKAHPEFAVPLADAIAHALKSNGWISGSGDGRRVIFQSVSAEAVARFKASAPSVPATLLYSPPILAFSRPDPIGAARRAHADLIGPRVNAASGTFIEQAHEAGLAVHVWTVDDPPTQSSLLAAGADGFFTNRPDAARRIP